jgi:hypothetical protein
MSPRRPGVSFDDEVMHMARRLRLVDGEGRRPGARPGSNNHNGGSFMSHRLKLLGFELVNELQRQGHDPMLQLIDSQIYWTDLFAAASAEYDLLDQFERQTESGTKLFERMKGYRMLADRAAEVLMPYFHSRLSNLTVSASGKTKEDEDNEVKIIYMEAGDEKI